MSSPMHWSFRVIVIIQLKSSVTIVWMRFLDLSKCGKKSVLVAVCVYCVGGWGRGVGVGGGGGGWVHACCVRAM